MATATKPRRTHRVVGVMSDDIGAVHSAAVPYPIDSGAEFMNAPAYVDFIFGRPRCTLFTAGQRLSVPQGNLVRGSLLVRMS